MSERRFIVDFGDRRERAIRRTDVLRLAPTDMLARVAHWLEHAAHGDHATFRDRIESRGLSVTCMLPGEAELAALVQTLTEQEAPVRRNPPQMYSRIETCEVEVSIDNRDVIFRLECRIDSLVGVEIWADGVCNIAGQTPTEKQEADLCKVFDFLWDCLPGFAESIEDAVREKNL